MHLLTENRIATVLLREAAELHRKAEKEGVQVYLQQPKVRSRPNSRFLTATVLGVQQSNRAVEENEMWRARQKELELDDRLQERINDEDDGTKSCRGSKESDRKIKRQCNIEVDVGCSFSSRKRLHEDCYLMVDEGLGDVEVDEFLHSRSFPLFLLFIIYSYVSICACAYASMGIYMVSDLGDGRIKRGRGAVCSRMDETGPYLPSGLDTTEKQLVASDVVIREGQKKRVVLGPGKPSPLVSWGNSEVDSFLGRKLEAKKAGSSKQCPRKHKSKDKSRSKDKKRKRRTREEKRSKRHHK